ncbi:MAG: hypothetical protein FJW14_11240 [Acidimicrobiia bacterium]|nr:hypothetical protein [Acidimicrobiia bacterium]
MPPGSDNTTRSGAPAAAVLPREATLDGFVQCASGTGISLRELEPLTTLLVGTCNTQYRIIVSRQSAILVQGGRFFPEVTTAHLDGSSAGGSFLKVAWIGVGLRMEISAGGQRIVTSPVRSITTEREPRGSRPH